MKAKGRRRRGGNKGAVLLISAIVAVLLIGMTAQSQELIKKNNSYKAQKTSLEEQIAAENARTEEIADLEEYMQSQEYIEKVAKDKLGLIYEDEIIFKPES